MKTTIDAVKFNYKAEYSEFSYPRQPVKQVMGFYMDEDRDPDWYYSDEDLKSVYWSYNELVDDEDIRIPLK